jgi:hypothetical protein
VSATVVWLIAAPLAIVGMAPLIEHQAMLARVQMMLGRVVSPVGDRGRV